MLHINVVEAVLTKVRKRVNNAAIKLSARSRYSTQSRTGNWQTGTFGLKLIVDQMHIHEGYDVYCFDLPASDCVYASHSQYCRTYATFTENLPRTAQPPVWHSIIPKAFRSPKPSRVPAKPQPTKDWNPATFFICIFLLIGSNAIQMLTLKNEYSQFSRKADAKIKLLKDVLDKVQRGENVDVEKVLGTGDEEQEQEWRDVLRNIEEEDQLWQAKDRRREKKRPQKEQETEADGAGKVAEQVAAGDTDPGKSTSTSNVAKKPPGFY